jgi:SnoaL-like polyketide cyclase
MDGITVCTQAQLEMFGSARLELVDELTTPDVIDHGAPLNGTHGREALKDTIRWLHSGLDDVAYEVKDVFQSDDEVVIRCTARGTNTREPSDVTSTVTGRPSRITLKVNLQARDQRPSASPRIPAQPDASAPPPAGGAVVTARSGLVPAPSKRNARSTIGMSAATVANRERSGVGPPFASTGPCRFVIRLFARVSR